MPIHLVTVTYPSAAGTRLPSQAKALQLSVSRITRADTQNRKAVTSLTVVAIGHHLLWLQVVLVYDQCIAYRQTAHKWTAIDCLNGGMYSVVS